MRGQQAKKNWRHRVLGDLGEVVSGGTPSRTAPSFWNGNIPWATPTDITRLQDKYISNTAERITENGLAGSSAHLLPAGSLLVTSRATLGEAAIATVPIATNQGFKSIVPNAETHRVFAYYVVKTLKPKMLPLASGTTFLEIGKGDFCRIPVRIPDFDEQSRIAYVLDTIDEAIQKTEAVIAKLKQIRAGMLYDLLTYGLDKDGKLRDPIAHPEQFKDSELGRIPKEWDVISLKDTGQIVSGGTPSRANLSYWNGDIPWITPTDMTALRGDYISGGEDDISEQGLMSSAAVLLPKGAIVVSSRATLGLAAVVSKPLATNQGFKNIIPHKEWNSVLICHIVRKLKSRMVQQASGTTFLEISAAEFGRLKFVAPHPGSDEQATIVERIESIDCTISSFFEAHTKLFSLKSGLMDDLLSGNVPVPKDLFPKGVPA